LDEQYRTKILKDGTMLTQRLYCLEPGFSVWCPDKSCAFCKHCNDLFYDYTSGPYMFLCDEDQNGELDMTDVGCIGKCDRFVEDEEIEERNREMEKEYERLKEVKEIIENDEEAKERYKFFCNYLMDSLLYGEKTANDNLEKYMKEYDVHELGVEDGGEAETEKADGRDQ